MNAHTRTLLNSLSDKLTFLPFCIFYLILIFISQFPLHHFLHLLIISPYYLPSTVSPTPDLFSVLVTPSQCWRLDGEVPALSDSQVQRHPMNFFTERAGMRFQGACNHTNTHTAYTNTLILFSSPTHCSSSPSFNLLFLATPLFLPHSLPFFICPLFPPPLSPSLLSCLGVKFSRCTWWQHHPGAPVSCLPSSPLLCCHRGHREVNLETVATINSCILLF